MYTFMDINILISLLHELIVMVKYGFIAVFMVSYKKCNNREEDTWMTKSWDKSMRMLVQTDPQAFVDFAFPGAYYVQRCPEKLRNWQLEVDALLPK